MTRGQVGNQTTLMDLARATGLSHMTVQRALTGSPTVRPETRERVLAAAEKMGYRPNASARAMRNGRFNHIGVLTSTDWSRANLTLHLLDGIDDVLASHDMHLVLARLSDEEIASEEAMPRVIRQSMIDGLLIKYDNRVPAPMIAQLKRFQIPHVWINIKRDCDCVHPDDLGAATDATRRFIDLGHRRITYLDYSYDPGDPNEHYSAVDRMEGYRSAMTRAKLVPDIWRERVNGHEQRVFHARSLLSRADPPTAIITYGESSLWPLHLAMRDLGERAPQTQLFSLDGRIPEYLGLRITHYEVDQVELGRRAAETLLLKLENPKRRLPPVRVPFFWRDLGPLLPPPV